MVNLIWFKQEEYDVDVSEKEHLRCKNKNMIEKNKMHLFLLALGW